MNGMLIRTKHLVAPTLKRHAKSRPVAVPSDPAPIMRSSPADDNLQWHLSLPLPQPESLGLLMTIGLTPTALIGFTVKSTLKSLFARLGGSGDGGGGVGGGSGEAW